MASDDDQSALVLGAATEASSAMEASPPNPETAGKGRVASTGGAAALVTAGILLSKIVGLVRNRVTAHYFGTSAFADALVAGFRVGNITQNLLGEGTLSASFIPVYARLRAGGREAEARRFALASLGLILVVSAAASLVGALLAPWLTYVIAAGFDEDRLAITARVVRVLFPMTGLLVVSAWGLGVLNAHRRFFLPYAAPVVWSLAQIGALIVCGAWLGWRGESLAMAVAWGALAGAALQLALLLPAARALLGGLRPRLDTKDPNVREAAAKLPSALLGRGVIQISGLVDTLLVSLLGTGAVAAFGYAQTVYLLPMSLLGTGEAAVALPEMAGVSAEADRALRDAALRKRIGASLSRVTVLTAPTMLVFLLFGHELIAVLLKGGTFGAEAEARVVPLLAAYAFALLGNASGRVLTTTSYAIGDAKTPARYAVYRVVASTVGALILMRWFDVMGVVLGAVIAAWVETIALGLKLRAQLSGLGLELVPVRKTIALAAISVAPGLALKALMPAGFGAIGLGVSAEFVQASLVLASFAVSFAIAAVKLGIFDLRGLLRRRR